MKSIQPLLSFLPPPKQFAPFSFLLALSQRKELPLRDFD
jgi:hypothetical protein